MRGTCGVAFTSRFTINQDNTNRHLEDKTCCADEIPVDCKRIDWEVAGCSGIAMESVCGQVSFYWANHDKSVENMLRTPLRHSVSHSFRKDM